jgi:Domain of unknown function (DUF2341)
VNEDRPGGRRRALGVLVAVTLLAVSFATPALARALMRNFVAAGVQATANVTAYDYNAATNVTYTSTADFNTGALVNTLTSTVANSVVLASPPIPAPAWWNVAWTRRACANVNHTGAGATTVTEYTLRVPFDTATLIAASQLQADGRDLRAISAAGVPIPMWIEGPINSTQTIVWVQIPTITAGTTTSFCFYYGNAAPATPAVSDQLAVFSYSTAKPIFYPVSNRYTTNPTTAAAVAYTAGTATSGASTLTLATGVPQNFPAAQVTPTGAVAITKPIASRGTGVGFDALTPISFASTAFTVGNGLEWPGTNPIYSLFAPFANTKIDVKYLGVAVPGSPFIVPAGTATSVTVPYTSDGAVIITASAPILVHHVTDTGRLSVVPDGQTTETQYGVVDAYSDLVFQLGGNAQLQYSNGTSTTFTGAGGGAYYFAGTAGGGSAAQGLAITGTVPVSAYANASNDGVHFMRKSELSNMYRIPTAANYATFSCPVINTTIRINLSPTPVTVNCTTTGGGPFPAGTPGKALYTGAIPAGTLIETTSVGLSPFFMYYNDSVNNSHTNVWGPKQSRQFTFPEPVVSFGGYVPAGTWESPTIDTTVNGVFGTLSWNAATPAGTTLRFQVAASASPTGPFLFVGPDSTALTFFTTTPIAVPFSLDGLRYARVRASFSSTSTATTPQLDDITIGTNLLPMIRPTEGVGARTVASAAGTTVTTYLVRLKTPEAGLAGSTMNVTHRGGSTNLANLTSTNVRVDAVAHVTVAAGAVTLAAGPSTAFDASNPRSIVLVSQTAAAAQTTVLKTAINVDVGAAGGSPLLIFDLDVTITS